MALAAAYGTSATIAAFRVSQTATLIPLNLVTSDALNSGFLPLHARAMKVSRQEADQLYRYVQWTLLLVSSLVGLVAFLCAGTMVSWLAPGLTQGAQQQASEMLRVMSLGIPIFVAGSMNSYLGLSLGHFRLSSWRSTIQNFGMLLSIGIAALSRHAVYLAWGFTLSAALYAGLGSYYVSRLGLLEFAPKWEGWPTYWRRVGPVARVVRGLLPIPLLLQANEALERVVASTVSTEALAATEYANYIVDTCVTLLAIPLGLAGLANVGHAEDVSTAASHRLRQLIGPVLCIGIPLSVTLTAATPTIVGFVYGRGQFNASSIAITSRLVSGFGVGLWAQVLGYVALKFLSGTLRTGRLAMVTTVGLGLSVITMTAAIPTNDPAFIGFSGSVYGVTILVLGCSALHTVRRLLKWLCWLVIPTACYSLLLLLPIWQGTYDVVAKVGVGLIGWGLFLFMFPPSRRELLRLLSKQRLQENPEGT